MKFAPYTVGVDFGTLSARAVVADSRDGRILASCESAYAHGVLSETLPDGTALPPQWALQVPQDYLDALTAAVRDAVAQSGASAEEIAAIGWDFTSCTVLPTDGDGTPLCTLPGLASRPHAYCKLWKHHAAQHCAARMEALARQTEQPFLRRYGGRISSEWTYPKLLQILEEDAALAEKTAVFLEAGDWLLWQLTGTLVRNSCAAGFKQFWAADGQTPDDDFLKLLHPGFPALCRRALRGEVCAPWEQAGTLTAEWAHRLGLQPGTVVAAGIVDAHASVIGAGASKPGQAVIIVGTSSCQLLVDDRAVSVPGICGYAKNSILPDMYAYESGQPAVGDLFDWFVRRCVPEKYAAEAREQDMNAHQLLTAKAAALAPGESGLVALDWWNGQRSPFVDDDLSGVMLGLTLRTRPEEQYRALLEGCAYGVRLIFDTYRKAGLTADEYIVCGGIARKNELMMQIYADVLGCPVHICESTQACALGSAILAAAAAGCHSDMASAVAAMAAPRIRTYTPDPERSAVYDQLYAIYESTARHFALQSDALHRLMMLRRGKELNG